MSKKISIRETKNQMIQDTMKNLYQMIVNYVSIKQNNEGLSYLNTQLNESDRRPPIFCDILNSQSETEDSQRIEKCIYGIKVVNNQLYVVIGDLNSEILTDMDFAKANWIPFLDNKNNIVAFSTLLCIADCIEQY